MEEALIKRVMPHSIEAEQSVVGAMLMDKDAITTAGEIISGDDFYQASYGVIFDSMIELFNEGKPVDLITLQERLKEKDVPAEIASLEFVRDLVTAVPTSANVKYYAQIVADKSLMRKMIKLNESIENMCYAGKEQYEDAQELGKKIEAGKIEVAIKMGEGGKAFGSVSSKEIAEEVKKQMDLTIDKKKVQLKEAIRTLGTHNVPVKLHPKVTAELKVVVKEEA